jgi:hypothetical protein
MRFLSVVNREIQTKKKELAIYGITIVLVLLVNETARAVFGRFTGTYPTGNAYGQLFGGFLLLGGLILTSMSFAYDMFDKEGQNEWLMLPATSAEKFLAKGLLAAIAYPVALLLLTVLSSALVESLLLLAKSPFSMFDPFSRQVAEDLLSYYVWQSVFLLGATVFRKNQFIKTVLSLFVLFIAMGLLTLLFARILFPMITGLSPFAAEFSVRFSDNFSDYGSKGIRVFVGFGKIVYYGLLPLFCWITAYFKVKEVQATDAI